jgi:hypothetical protein
MRKLQAVLLSIMMGLLGGKAYALFCVENVWVRGGPVALLLIADGSYFTILDEPRQSFILPVGRVMTIDPDFRFGYVIETGWQFAPCWDLRASWQDLNCHFFRCVQASPDGAVWLTGLPPDNATEAFLDNGIVEERDDIRYGVLDGELSRWIGCCKNRLSVRLFGSLRYAQIRYNQCILYLRSPTELRDGVLFHSHSAGLGPRLGAALQIPLRTGLHCLCWLRRCCITQTREQSRPRSLLCHAKMG